MQLWVAQPEGTRHGEAGFEHHDELPRLEVADRAELARLLVRVHGHEHPWLARVLPC